MLQADLVQALKSLADSTGKHADATQAQANAALHHHKVPEMPMPTFHPAECKNNPLAWSNFWQRFELFTVDCVDDKSRMGFLLSAVKGDASDIVNNFKCTEANYNKAKEALEKHYNKSETIRELLLLQCLRFRVPKVNSDLSNFVSSVIKLNVYISELKQNHGIDILAENSGRQLIRAVVQDILPGDILDKYQILTGVEYPTLEQFISNAQKVAERICRKQKNKQKDGNNSGTNSNNVSQNAANIVTSTIPSSISTVNTRPSRPFKPKKCLFCGDQGHLSSRCPKFPTVKERAAEIKTKIGSEPCDKCLFVHKQNATCTPCTIAGCTSKDTHGALACPLILDQLNPNTSNNTKAVTVTTNKRNCSVALPTLTAQIECSINDKSLQSVGVLLDTAAQQSLIHRNVVERLGIEAIR